MCIKRRRQHPANCQSIPSRLTWQCRPSLLDFTSSAKVFRWLTPRPLGPHIPIWHPATFTFSVQVTTHTKSPVCGRQSFPLEDPTGPSTPDRRGRRQSGPDPSSYEVSEAVQLSQLPGSMTTPFKTRNVVNYNPTTGKAAAPQARLLVSAWML